VAKKGHAVNIESMTSVKTQTWNDSHLLAVQNKWIRLWQQKVTPDETLQALLKKYDEIDHMIAEIFIDRVKKYMVAEMSRFQGWVQTEKQKEMAQWIYYFKQNRKTSLTEMLLLLNQASASIKACLKP
jgi:uncharacterized damage-inducible protein DinB